MKNLLSSMLLLGLAVSAQAGGPPVPEIGATTAMGALTLISGAVLVLRSRRK